MSSSSIGLLIAYLSVAGLSGIMPALEKWSPRVAAVVQTLAAFGLDLPRLVDALRRLVTGASAGVPPVPATPAAPAPPQAPTAPTPKL